MVSSRVWPPAAPWNRVTVMRNSPPIRRKTPMLSRPPRTITTPDARRTPTPNRFSKSSGSVITRASRSGFTQKPVTPTKNMARAWRIPGVAPAKPYR